jgi:flavin reductase (DIM6/NTAB) family NADH-FMN oxidoreductase RutF
MAEFSPNDVAPQLRALLVNTLVAPRPIAFVSTLSAEGVGNLAPFSFFMAGGYDPASVCFSTTAPSQGPGKDTLRNIEATGEFVINIAVRSIIGQLNQASYPYPAHVDEFDRVGLTRAPSTKVRPPRVAESPASLECRLFQIVKHGDRPSHANYIIGEIVHIHAAESILTDSAPDVTKIEHVARLGGAWYDVVSQETMFALTRPTAP